MSERGFGLIEVVVSLLVLAVGILAMTNLQAVSLQSVISSHQRSQAVAFANDILDRIRVNTDAAMNDNYNLAGTIIPMPSNTCRGVGVMCTPPQIAQADLGEWTNALATSLPDSRAWITRNGSVFEVVVGWNGNRVQPVVPTCRSDTNLNGLVCLVFSAEI